MEPKKDELPLAVGVTPETKGGQVTARRAGDMKDMQFCVSPRSLTANKAMQNMTKAINLALKTDFLETELDKVYKGARVNKGRVQMMHMDYIGLGDGIFAHFGRAAKSIQLSFRGPDAASPEGKAWIEQHGGSAFGGMVNLIGRKLDLFQEFEDKVPMYVEQMLDRLEGQNVITDWHRDEWEIATTTIGLDVILTPLI